jgi:hypothetical protein
VANLEIEDEVLGSIVVAELKGYYTTLDETCSDWYLSEEEKIKERLCLDAIIIVLSHYMTGEEHTQWLESIVEKTQK